ncbi:MAG: tetratricopeptide repeat protein [Elusimicrobiota bacterium]
MRQLLILLALAAPAAAARQSSLTPEMDRLVLSGIDGIYRMDFDAADAAARAAMALDPAYPHAYLGAAATDFIRYIYGPTQTDDRLVKSFEKKTEVAIAVAEAWLKTHPNDAEALLVLGSGYGIRARLALERHQYLKGWTNGSRSMKYIRASLKADPEIYDSYLGLGMFDYYVDTIPRFAGWLAKIMLGGNRARGLQELRLAAEKGHFARTAAQLILVEIDTQDEFGARNPPDAVKLMKGIREKYPDSSMLHSAHVVSLYEAGKFDEGLREAREYLARVQAGRYAAANLPVARALTGTMLWGLGRKEEALAEYRAGGADPSPLSSWTILDRARAGQVLDALGRRAEALAAYKSAYADDRWDTRPYIKPCLAAPCVGAKFPGRFAPR